MTGGGEAEERTGGRDEAGQRGGGAARRWPCRLTAVILVTILACAGPRQNVDPEPLDATGFSLVLNNRHVLDVNIFIQHDGQSDRVATVVASTTRAMALPAWMLGQSKAIRLIAEPIGEDSRYMTDILVVQPGQVVELNVEGSLARSNYSIQ